MSSNINQMMQYLGFNSVQQPQRNRMLQQPRDVGPSSLMATPQGYQVAPDFTVETSQDFETDYGMPVIQRGRHPPYAPENMHPNAWPLMFGVTDGEMDEMSMHQRRRLNYLDAIPAGDPTFSAGPVMRYDK